MRSPFEARRLLIVTDAWSPQVNGVVRTLASTIHELSTMGVESQVLDPSLFRTLPCPGDSEIRLAVAPPSNVERLIEQAAPDALHIATEGPLGWAARRVAIRRGWRFTSAYHTRFPEYLQARAGVPLAWTYGYLNAFHRPSHAVLVPSQHVMRQLSVRGFSRLRYWGRGVDHQVFAPGARRGVVKTESPIFLYAGRIAAEKNIEAFLQLELPGEKWVAGDGPLRSEFQRRYPTVRWFGSLCSERLADVYRQADVFVFPSKTDTFGLVMVEAMACGLPVAAYPVPGPLDVIGRSKAGVMSHDLRAACLKCLELPREFALQRAAHFSWRTSAEQFLGALVPMRPPTTRKDFYEPAQYPALSGSGPA
jgi:glycosyltransferase involved in cell wall biosynthesis